MRKPDWKRERLPVVGDLIVSLLDREFLKKGETHIISKVYRPDGDKDNYRIWDSRTSWI